MTSAPEQIGRAVVVHCKRQPYDVYIGRGKGSIYGNPFVIGPDGSRNEVIAKFRAWLPEQPHLMARVHELHGKVLGCFCAPQACHGHVLAEFAEAAFRQRHDLPLVLRPAANQPEQLSLFESPGQ